MYPYSISFEFDPEKSRRNLEKHGICFEAAKEFWSVMGVEKESRRGVEVRWIRIGLWEGKFYSCIYTRRHGAIRLISVRRSREQEEKFYEEKLRNEKKEEEHKDDHSRGAG